MKSARVIPVPGNGLVTAGGEAVLVMASLGADQGEGRDALVAALRAVSGEYSETPGDELARRLLAAALACRRQAVPPFAATAPSGDGLAVILSRSMEATWFDGDTWHRLSGRQATSWVDQVLTGPIHQLALGVEPLAPVNPDDVTDLRDGTVRADAAILEFAGRAGLSEAPASGKVETRPVSPPEVAVDAEPEKPGGPEPTGPPAAEQDEVSGRAQRTGIDAGETAPESAPAATPAEQAASGGSQLVSSKPRGEFVIVDLTGRRRSDNHESSGAQLGQIPPAEVANDEAPRAPLPVAQQRQTVPPSPIPASGGADEVSGVLCARMHFNHPLARFCAVCGLDFNQLTRNVVHGVRPPLGVLVVDNGEVFNLDSDYVIGREPNDAPEIARGDARPLVLADVQRSVSRIHAAVTLNGWDVAIVDKGSANGTLVLTPGASEWVRLMGGRSIVMPPGTRVAVGSRALQFESHHVGS